MIGRRNHPLKPVIPSLRDRVNEMRDEPSRPDASGWAVTKRSSSVVWK